MTIEQTIDIPVTEAEKPADLPPDITAKDIREMRLKEKYGKEI
ncbi:MAG: hypothetical protein Pg6C_10950 [Treponemataceae bacterium]|nr:MAG: hypothetical protein Pg6C_10950 [Treponemataceae bacterium]